MPWTKPDFQEITLNMEVTAYVNTEDEVRKSAQLPKIGFPSSCRSSTPVDPGDGWLRRYPPESSPWHGA